MNKLRLFIVSIFFLIPMLVFAQRTIKGAVTEQTSGEPLPGVNIQIQGTNQGTTTDFDGNYVIENVIDGSILEFSYLGYETQTIEAITGTINVALSESAESLEEVVVIGYGTTTIKDATGSVAAITSKDFNEGNIVTPASLITGRVAGVNVTTGGAPGGGSTIRIRGGSSLSASNDPLIVIDGMPISNDSADGTRHILSSINPNDIDSFSILKDASATAIYGSRASNGVIIITTKKGKSTFQASLDYKIGYLTLADKIEVFSADEFRDLIAERVESGQTGISVDQLGNANTDWQDEIYKEDYTQDLSFSMSGALYDEIPARFSMGYTDQPGLMITSRFQRGTTSLSLNPSLFKDHLKINLNSNLNFEKSRYAEGVQHAVLEMDPTQPVYDANSPFGGFFEYHTEGEPNNATRNPVASLLQYRDLSNVNFFYGNAEFDYKFHFLPDLRAVVNVGYDKSSSDGTKKRSTSSIRGYRTGVNEPFLGSDEYYTGDRSNKLLDGYLAYEKDFNNVGLDITGGYSYQSFESEGFSSGNVIDPNSESDVETDPEIRLIGFFGRTNLSFMDKYLLTLSYRRDGTSRFSEENRWGDFPAAAFAWKISEEDFLKNSKRISDLKLRLGWGITGQQDIEASYAYLGRYLTGSSIAQYIFGNTSYPVGIPQSKFEDLKWEETTTYNVGLDYGLFDDLFTGSLEVYLKESKDLLANVAVSDGSNFSNTGWQNIGELTTKGIEFSIGTDIVSNENTNWNVNYNLSLNEIKIDKLAQGQDIETGGIGGGTGSRIQIHREGFEPYSFFVFKQLYDANGDPIEGAYADINQDGVINTSDRYIYKDANTNKFLMGFQSTFNYKDFDFAFNLRASIGNYVYNNVNSSKAQYNLLQATTALGNIPTTVLETGFTETANVLISDYFIENASFLKMDNVTVGYTFDDLKINLSSIRLWGGVQNVYTLTNYTGLDPEIFSGIDNTIFPRPRTFLVGANIKF